MNETLCTARVTVHPLARLVPVYVYEVPPPSVVDADEARALP